MDPAARLARALRESAATAGLAAEAVDARAQPWASATFNGERVTLRLTLTGDAATWLASLPEADLPMRGWFVADLRVLDSDIASAAVEALVLEQA